MTDIYIDSDVVSGGVGSSGDPFHSLDSAEISERQDLVVNTDSYNFFVRGAAADTTGAGFASGWTTSAAYDITIEPEAGEGNQTGIWDTGIYRISTSNTHQTALRIAQTCHHVTVRGMQLEVNDSNSDCLALSGEGGVQIADGNICKGMGAVGTHQHGIYAGWTGSDTFVLNNIVFDTGAEGIQCPYTGSGDRVVYNNTIDGAFTSGLELASGSASYRAFNNLITNSAGSDYVDAGSAVTGNNITSDGTGPNVTGITIDYNDPANYDYSLAATDTDAIGGGFDLSSDPTYPFSHDMVGATRGWDCGALVYAGASTTPVNNDSTLQWNLIAGVFNDSDTRWSLLNSALNDSNIQWDLLEGVDSEFESRWDILEAINSDSQAQWNLLNSAFNDSDLRWNLLNSLFNDTDVRWNILNSLINDSNIQWDLLSSTFNDTDVRWNIASALSAVLNDSTLQWDLLNSAFNDSDVRWSLLNSALNDSNIRWDILNSALNDSDIRWNIDSALSAVFNDATLNWDLIAGVFQSLASVWDVLGAVENNTDLRWNILNSAYNDISAQWDLLAGISGDSSIQWDIISTTENDMTLRWSILTDSSFADLTGTITVQSKTPIFKITTH